MKKHKKYRMTNGQRSYRAIATIGLDTFKRNDRQTEDLSKL